MLEKLVTIVLRARGVRRVPPLRITSIQTSSSARIWDGKPEICSSSQAVSESGLSSSRAPAWSRTSMTCRAGMLRALSC